MSMEKTEIKRIEVLGKKLGQKVRPPVKEKNILFVAGFLNLKGFQVLISDGLLNISEFICRCIVLETKNKSATRFKNQINFFKKYLIKLKKKNIKQLSGKEYAGLINLAREKMGETKEYTKWREKAMQKTKWFKKLLMEYNKTRKDINKKERFSIYEFEDGTIRLDFDNNINQNLIEKIKKLSPKNKKKKMHQFLNEFKIFKEYLIKKY